MSEYRDELAAAHARIAELEDKVSVLSEELAPASRPFDGRFPELEERIARLRKPADEAANAKRRTRVSIIGAFFPLAGMIFTFLHLPVVATACSAAFILLILYNFALIRGLKAARKDLFEAEAKLADARRIADLENKLAAAGEGRVRVAAPEDVSIFAQVEDEELSEPVAQAVGARSRLR